MGIQSDSAIHHLSSFRISKQITLKEYKQYLNSIKDSSYAFYLSQLPKIERQEYLTKNYLNSTEFDNEPVIGVSMDNACNFARWYTTVQNKEKIKYRLPTVFEWISMNEERKPSSKDILLDWTLNAYDESAYDFFKRGEFPVGFFHKHKKYQPKVMKRKCVIGQSFRISLADPVKISSTFPCYADEGYADVGFRLIEVSRADYFDKYTNQDEVQSDISLKSLSNSLPIYQENVKIQSIELNGKLVEYTTRNGQLDGAFNVYKKVNNEKIPLVKGEMKNNCRIGYWTVYDENRTNKIVLQRLYHSPLEYEQLIPKPSSNKLVTFVQSELNPPLGLDKDGCKENAYVTSADFIFSKRLYREILFENNKFSSNGIFKSLDDALEKKDIISYDRSNFSVVSDKNHLHGFEGDVIGFRIKEDFFFDKNRKLSETRILGLAPIYFDTITNKKKEICWFYYPQIRKIFVKIKDPNLNSNLDNLFFERNFYGEIYKTADQFDREEDDDLGSEFKSIDIELLMTEHDIWLYFEGIKGDY
ncbi:MAG: SUMF1/EgtB/PvdO family nonheme iron enzyme [Crocinitomicaceae bacterium]